MRLFSLISSLSMTACPQQYVTLPDGLAISICITSTVREKASHPNYLERPLPGGLKLKLKFLDPESSGLIIWAEGFQTFFVLLYIRTSFIFLTWLHKIMAYLILI